MPTRARIAPADQSFPATGASDPSQSARERLLAAAAALVGDEGIAAASARAIAALAGASASAINYNFGNLERLLHLAFEAGVEQTRLCQARWGREIAALPRTPEGAALALLHVLQAWTGEGRRLALTYQEAVTATPGQGPAAAWTRLWRDFWLEAAERFGLPAIDGRLLHALFEHEALYGLSRWSPALEAAALTEIVERFAAIWLGASDRPARGATLLAERTAGTRPHGSVPPAAMRIAKAAAAVVEDKGLAGLTHRAVAARAGLTTGSVTHHFRSIEDLVAGAIRAQVQTMTEAVAAQSQGPAETPLSAEVLFEGIRLHVTDAAPSPEVVRRRRLFLATLRRGELAAAGGVIRFSYGGTLRDSLGQVFDLSGDDLILRAGVLARLVSAIWFACAGDEHPADTRLALFERIEARFLAAHPRQA